MNQTPESKSWDISVAISETTDETQAVSELTVDARRFEGLGKARRNPADPAVPRIGEELAVARSLTDLAHKLMDEATYLIEHHGSPHVPSS